MPTVFTHAVVGTSISYILYPEIKKWKFFLVSIFCSLLPDFDAISFKIGIKYSHFLGHRGFSHSILFAVIISFLLVLIFYRPDKLNYKRNLILFFCFFIIIITHSLLDAMTDGGLGVALYSPFDKDRIFLPWRFIKVSPLGLKELFSNKKIDVLFCEMKYLWIPSIIVVVIYRIIFRKRLGK